MFQRCLVERENSEGRIQEEHSDKYESLTLIFKMQLAGNVT